MFTRKKTAIVSVINDLVTDNRVNRTCYTLMDAGLDVKLVGRRFKSSLALPDWPFRTKRMTLLFTKGPAFYLFFNLRLFFVLLFTKADLLFANDLDTLLPNYLAARLKKIPLIYDSHELFCEVPELQAAPIKKKIWQNLENLLVPRLKHCITVNESIATIFENRYHVKFTVVRNIAKSPEEFSLRSRRELGLPEDKKIILLQGAGINVDRGAEELVDAMQFVDNAILLIIGGGDVWPDLEKRIEQQKLGHKVRLIKKLPRAELMQYTYNADIGVSIDKDNNPNYHNSLPNKIFDYLQAGLPVLATRLPELERIINDYGVGDFIENHQPQNIATAIRRMISDNTGKYTRGIKQANAEMNWPAEQKKLLELICHAIRP